MLKKRKRKEKPMSPYEYGGSYASKEVRQYDDYIKFRRENPRLYTTQFDFLGAPKESMMGVLVMRMPELRFTITKRLKPHDAKSVSAFFANLKAALGPEGFKKVFPLMLTDNEPCFSAYGELEAWSPTGELLTTIFFFHPYCSNEKASVEATNGQLRFRVAKGEGVVA